ncbi:hypothetical protein [Bacillus mycoides]|uniref:hypothetical protein n=1 Tax=Bacillus mycoides TaxID=1405 RepID=UPI0011EC00B6|nr:hypothetical protein [Bacillus mycoides]MED3466105.1 hypothetical protein [Bacillus thuringiensis]QEL88604.1 hypothetical protein DN409_30570 [Bacillus mycoides]
MKIMKLNFKFLILGMLALISISGCQMESDKAKEADKVAMEYIRAYIDMDTKQLNDLSYKTYDFGPDKVGNPGASKKIGSKYDLYRYELDGKKNEYYYKVVYYDPVEDKKLRESLYILQDKNGAWKNSEWAWGSTHNLDSIVGSKEPKHVHKWGEGE